MPRRFTPHPEPAWAVCSTGLVSDLSSFGFSTVAFVPGDISSESGARLDRVEPHGRCPYCGTARKPFTYVNCINCGAPA